MVPSVAVLRIWAHQDMEILRHSSEDRFRGGRFPLGSAMPGCLITDVRRWSRIRTCKL